MWLIVLASVLYCASAYDVDLKKLDGLAKARVEVHLTLFILCFIHDSRLYYINSDSGPKPFIHFPSLIFFNV